MKIINLFYIYIFGAIAFGLTLCYFLIPTDTDVALFQVQSGKYVVGKEYFLNEYNAGKRTPDIVIPLVEIEKNQGHLNEAIAILKQFLQQHPENPEALKLMADLYLANQQYDDYYQTLLQLQKYDKSGQVLQELTDWYQQKNHQDALFQGLQQLASKEAANASNLLDLAQLYAQRQDYADALSILEKRRQIFFKDVKIDDILFEIWVLSQQNGAQSNQEQFNKKALDLASNYLLKKNNPKDAYQALIIFNDLYPQLSVPLIEKIQPIIHKNEGLEILALQTICQQNPDNEVALKKLEGLYTEDPLNIDLQNIIFDLLLVKGNEKDLIDFIKKTPANTIQQKGIMNLFVFAVGGKPKLAKTMEEALGPQYLEQHPVIAVGAAIGAGDSDAKARLAELLKSKNLSQQDYLNLLLLASAAGYEQEALEAGAKLPNYIGLQDPELIDMTNAYVQVKKEKELSPLIEQAIPTLGTKKTGSMISMIDISEGRTRKVAIWLQSQKTISEPFLQSMYFAAEDKKQYPLALFIAKRLQADYPTSVNQAYYGYSLVQVGKMDAGLSILKHLQEKNSRDYNLESLYFQGLIFAAKYNDAYQQRLWKEMGEREQKAMSPSLRRIFAYAYLEEFHDFPKAEKIFADLSKNAPPSNNDLQTLLLVWGPQPSPKQVAWLENKAQTAPPKETGYWLSDLNDKGQQNEVIEIFEKRSVEDLEANAYFAYLDALNYKKKTQEMKRGLELAYSRLDDPKDLKNLSDYAEIVGDLQMRKKIWTKVIEKSPKDSEGWAGLAKSEFDSHNYKDAEIALKKVFQLSGPYYRLNPKLYESFYEYAEILKRKSSNELAGEYYSLALYHINQARPPTFYMQQMRAIIFDRQGYHRKAVAEMRRLYQHSFKDPNVGAALTNMLIDQGKLSVAKHYVECEDDED